MLSTAKAFFFVSSRVIFEGLFRWPCWKVLVISFIYSNLLNELMNEGYLQEIVFLISFNSQQCFAKATNEFLSRMSCVKCKICLHKKRIKHAQKSYSCDLSWSWRRNNTQTCLMYTSAVKYFGAQLASHIETNVIRCDIFQAKNLLNAFSFGRRWSHTVSNVT